MPRILVDYHKDSEEWRIIPSHPLYLISNYGRVKKISHGDKAWKDGYCLQWYDNGKGYPRVSLFENKKGKNFCIHILVAEAFIGPKPIGMEVNHINGNKKDNRPQNLEYCTRSFNNQHCYSLGLRKGIRGEKNPHCKISDTDVQKIRDLYQTGNYTQKQLAKQFGSTQAHISCIVLHKNRKGNK